MPEEQAVTPPQDTSDAPSPIDGRSVITEARREHLRKIGAKGGRALVKKRGRSWMQRIGTKGGETTAEYSYEDRRDWGMKGWKAKQDRSSLVEVREQVGGGRTGGV
jgi:hypothetical protein